MYFSTGGPLSSLGQTLALSQKTAWEVSDGLPDFSNCFKLFHTDGGIACPGGSHFVNLLFQLNKPLPGNPRHRP
jgi:hypothetical protein